LAKVQSKEVEQIRSKVDPSGIWEVTAGLMAAAGLRRAVFSAYVQGCIA